MVLLVVLYQAFISQISLKATQNMHSAERSKGLLTRMPYYIKIDSEVTGKILDKILKGKLRRKAESLIIFYLNSDCDYHSVDTIN